MVTVMLVLSMIVRLKVVQMDQGFEVVIKWEGGRTQRRRKPMKQIIKMKTKPYQ
jgi:hypothetical protein